MAVSALLPDLLKRRLLFVTGKGGVGKTSVSKAIAQNLARSGKRTLWVTIQDPLLPLGELKEIGERLSHLNCDPPSAFEEYIALKIGISGLARLFVRNSLMQYLSKAAPGVTEIVLMGKIWYETRNYDHVVVDMPSTGYGLAMFNSVKNYSRLFRSGPIQKDAEKMLTTFRDPAETGTLIVALPEEMPISESLELYDHLLGLFPECPAGFLVNKLFPKVKSELEPNPDKWPSPVPASASDYAARRTLVEAENLKAFAARQFPYAELELTVPNASLSAELLVNRLSDALTESAGSK